MNMTEILLWVSGFSLGFMVGEYYVKRKAQIWIRQILEDIEKAEQPKQESTSEYPFFFTEVVNGSIMLYSNTTQKFVCQGKTLEEVVQNAKQYANISEGVIRHDAGRLFTFTNGKLG